MVVIATMIKETTVKKDVAEKHKYCDVCGAEISIGLACGPAICMYCKRDLCNSCVGYEEESPGDYRIVWCKRCWQIGEYYRPKIQALSNERSVLYEEWKGGCETK